MAHEKITRRMLLKGGATVGLAVLGSGFLLSGCDKSGDDFTCDDTRGLSAADLQTRTSLKYVDKSPQADKTCDNCNLYTASNSGQCGTCTVVKGPIHPKGYCTAWVKKA